jgi:hypothetical protein
LLLAAVAAHNATVAVVAAAVFKNTWHIQLFQAAVFR